MGNAGVVTSRSIVGGRLAPVSPFRQTTSLGAVMPLSGVGAIWREGLRSDWGSRASAGVWQTGESPVGGQKRGETGFLCRKREAF